jgi:hypothetical protein
MEEHAPASRQEILTFLTTEHFTLQGGRASSSQEVQGRLQLYTSALSSSIISLALVAQISGVEGAFRGFPMVLLPTVYVLGLVTLGRMNQAWLAWFGATQGMGRIRRFYVELAPDAARYFVMPTPDDAWSTLRGYGIGIRPGWWEAMYAAPAAVALVNSIVAGVFVGILVHTLGEDVAGDALPAGAGAAAGLVSFVVLGFFGNRWFRRTIGSIEARFPVHEVPRG